MKERDWKNINVGEDAHLLAVKLQTDLLARYRTRVTIAEIVDCCIYEGIVKANEVLSKRLEERIVNERRRRIEEELRKNEEMIEGEKRGFRFIDESELMKEESILI